MHKHQADDSYLGYVFQGLFALIILLDSDDDESVSIETEDDVVLDGNSKTNIQLKHSLNPSRKLTVSNIGLWNTLGIWIAETDILSTKYLFVTCSDIASESTLKKLTIDKCDRSDVVLDLTKEAKRVIDEIENATKLKEALPHQKRSSACKAFINLSESDRQQLINKISIRETNFNIKQIEKEVEIRLRNVVAPDVSQQVAIRLTQWWEYRIRQSLTKILPRKIPKLELQQKIQSLLAEHSETNLPDDYSIQEPDSLAGEMGGLMERQILLVQGGSSRLNRAALARWRARNQRQRWMNSDIGLAAVLNLYDQRLQQSWEDRHGPMQDDCCEQPDEHKCKVGRSLLDWADMKAWQEIPPPRRDWCQVFYTCGMYHQLSDELKVGWHPDFLQLLANIGNGE